MITKCGCCDKEDVELDECVLCGALYCYDCAGTDDQCCDCTYALEEKNGT